MLAGARVLEKAPAILRCALAPACCRGHHCLSCPRRLRNKDGAAAATHACRLRARRAGAPLAHGHPCLDRRYYEDGGRARVRRLPTGGGQGPGRQRVADGDALPPLPALPRAVQSACCAHLGWRRGPQPAAGGQGRDRALRAGVSRRAFGALSDGLGSAHAARSGLVVGGGQLASPAAARQRRRRRRAGRGGGARRRRPRRKQAAARGLG